MALARELAQPVQVTPAEAGPVRDPHGPVLERMDAPFVRDRCGVEAAVLPHRRVASADRRALGVRDCALNVLALADVERPDADRLGGIGAPQ